MAATETTAHDVEGALLQMRTLLDAVIASHQRRSSMRSHLEVLPDDGAVRETMTQLVRNARSEVLCAGLGSQRSEDQLQTILALKARRRANEVTVQMLCTPETLESPRGMRFLRRAESAGILIRVADYPLEELVMVDEQALLIRAEFGRGARQAVMARTPPVLRTMRSLYAALWEMARRTDGHRWLDGCQQPELVRQILPFLSAGYKDDAAARDLNVSVRTYRRHVAEIMRCLGANSRFQAGVLVSELGVLPRIATPPQTTPLGDGRGVRDTL